MALGDGQVGTKQHSFELKVGETVLYSKFGIGVTDLEVQGQVSGGGATRGWGGVTVSTLGNEVAVRVDMVRGWAAGWGSCRSGAATAAPAAG